MTTSNTSKIALGVDPGKHSGWAVVQGQALLAFGLAESPAAIIEACRIAVDLGATEAWCEDQYIDSNKSKHAIQGPASSAGEWKMAWYGASRLAKYNRVMPDEWRRAVLGRRIWRPGMERATCKEVCKMAMGSMYPELLGQKLDVFEAVAIARYGALK